MKTPSFPTHPFSPLWEEVYSLSFSSPCGRSLFPYFLLPLWEEVRRRGINSW